MSKDKRLEVLLEILKVRCENEDMTEEEYWGRNTPEMQEYMKAQREAREARLLNEADDEQELADRAELERMGQEIIRMLKERDHNNENNIG